MNALMSFLDNHLLLANAISFAIYFAPTIVAVIRKHPSVRSIFGFNFFLGLGWGWFAAFYYAVRKKIPTKGKAVLFFFLNFVTLLLVIDGPRITSKMAAPEKLKAQQTLQSLGSSLENFAKEHQGVYPNSIAVLNSANPTPVPDVCERKIGPFQYHCEFSSKGYLIFAATDPKYIKNIHFVLETGGKLTEE